MLTRRMDKMPPVHSKLQEAPKILALPDDSLDLFDIVTNVVTKSNSQIVYKKAKPKRKFKFPCGICDKSFNKNQKSILAFTATTVVSGSTNLVKA